jgi:hypothetical protein
MKKLMPASLLFVVLLLSSCSNSKEQPTGGKIISIRDQIGLTDSLENGNSNQQGTEKEAIEISNLTPVEQLKVMVEAIESKNNALVNSFINYDSLDANGSLDYFDYVLFSGDIPSEYSKNKKAYMKRNSHKIMPSYLKSELIKAASKGKGRSIDRVTFLKNSEGEFSLGANSNGSNDFQFNVNQDYPDGNGGGSFSYRFHIGSDKRISLVQIMPFGGSISF